MGALKRVYADLDTELVNAGQVIAKGKGLTFKGWLEALIRKNVEAETNKQTKKGGK